MPASLAMLQRMCLGVVEAELGGSVALDNADVVGHSCAVVTMLRQRRKAHAGRPRRAVQRVGRAAERVKTCHVHCGEVAAAREYGQLPSRDESDSPSSGTQPLPKFRNLLRKIPAMSSLNPQSVSLQASSGTPSHPGPLPLASFS